MIFKGTPHFRAPMISLRCAGVKSLPRPILSDGRNKTGSPSGWSILIRHGWRSNKTEAVKDCSLMLQSLPRKSYVVENACPSCVADGSVSFQGHATRQAGYTKMANQRAGNPDVVIDQWEARAPGSNCVKTLQSPHFLRPNSSPNYHTKGGATLPTTFSFCFHNALTLYMTISSTATLLAINTAWRLYLGRLGRYVLF